MAYQPVTSERFDLHLPNGVSHQAFDLEGLLERLAMALEGGLEADAALVDARRKLVDRHLTATTGPFAAERIVSALEEFAEGYDAFRLPSLRSTLEGRARAAWRGARKALESRRPGDRNSREYLLHMFPGVGVEYVGARIARFRALLERFSHVETRRLFENVFLVESR